MKELQNKQVLRNKIYSLPVLATLLLVAVLTVRGAHQMVVKERFSKAESENLVIELEKLTIREGELKKETEKLETSAGIEEEIKSKFNVAKAGEFVAVIVDRKTIESTTTPEKLSWWKRFWSGIIDP